MFWTVVLLLHAALVTLASAQGASQESRLVTISQGPIRGYKDPEDGIFIFYGIPYATAPTGPNRFKAPLSPPSWLTTFEAVDQGIMCPQLAFYQVRDAFHRISMGEDCLVANVYVPDTAETNLPVVVYIHGGGFTAGYGNFMTPKTLVKSKKVIAVTFNYRLGVHGFLCLGTELAPGNAGMKDQVALLRWIKKNIGNFGGNPEEVTIAGYSAGSSSVELIMLSDITQGLFNKVIPESGSALGHWSVQMDPLNNAKNYARRLNFTNYDDIDALGEFYATIPFELLLKGNIAGTVDPSAPLSPCIERDIGVERFLHEAPMDILKKGEFNKYPLLYGFSNMEGLLQLGDFQSSKNLMNENFSEFLPVDLQFDSEEQRKEIGENSKRFYFNGQTVSNETVLGYINYYTDILFAYPILKSLQLQVQAGSDSIYLYEYTFVDPYAKKLIPEEFGIQGAYHCAQTMAVLEGNLVAGVWLEDDYDENFEKVKLTMTELWLNFITTGKPVPEDSQLLAWPPSKEDSGPYMCLNKTMELKDRLIEERFLFLNDLYEKHYRHPQPPGSNSHPSFAISNWMIVIFMPIIVQFKIL